MLFAISKVILNNCTKRKAKNAFLLLWKRPSVSTTGRGEPVADSLVGKVDLREAISLCSWKKKLREKMRNPPL